MDKELTKALVDLVKAITALISEATVQVKKESKNGR